MGTNANGHGKRAAFIVFEGLDRSGKSTQSKFIVDKLNEMGINAQLLKFPTRQGPIGSIIDKYLRKELNLTDQSVHLLFSADRWETRSQILEYVNSGVVVIADRYAYSGIAFSAAKGLSRDWCLSSDTGLPAPDRVIFLDISSEKAGQRDGFGEERFERAEFQKKVMEQYRDMMVREKQLGNEWTVIDGNRSEREVEEDVLREVLSVVEKTRKEGVKK